MYGHWLNGLRVGKDYHVYIDGNRYSVPHRLIGAQVEAKVTARSIRIFHAGKFLWTHPRAQGSDQQVTDSLHMTENHRHAALQRLAGMKAHVRSIGLEAEDLIEAHYRSNQKPRSTARAATALVILADQYGPERVRIACAKALVLKKPSAGKVEGLLMAGLEGFEPEVLETPVPLPPSGNVRGSAYFASEMGAQITRGNDE